MSKIFTRTFRVRWSEVEASQRVGAAQYLEYLVETAYDWGESLGLGEQDSQRLGITWVIRETEIEFMHPLCYNDEFTFTIWMVEWRRVHGRRAFELRRLGDDLVIARGTQRVACLGQETLRPVAVPKELIDHFRLDAPRTFPKWQLPKNPPLTENPFKVKRRVERGDLDMLEHTNNAAYVRIADETIWRFLESLGWPHSRLASLGLGVVPRRLQVLYQQLSRWGDQLDIAIYPLAVREDGWQTLTSVTNPLQDHEVVKLHQEWGLVERASDEQRQLPGELRGALGVYLMEGENDG